MLEVGPQIVHIVSVQLIRHVNIKAHEVKKADLQVVQLNIWDAAHSRVVVVIVENIVVELGADQDAGQHKSRLRLSLPVNVIRRDAETRMLDGKSVDVNKSDDKASFWALRVTSYSD